MLQFEELHAMFIFVVGLCPIQFQVLGQFFYGATFMWTVTYAVDTYLQLANKTMQVNTVDGFSKKKNKNKNKTKQAQQQNLYQKQNTLRLFFPSN